MPHCVASQSYGHSVSVCLGSSNSKARARILSMDDDAGIGRRDCLLWHFFGGLGRQVLVWGGGTGSREVHRFFHRTSDVICLMESRSFFIVRWTDGKRENNRD